MRTQLITVMIVAGCLLSLAPAPTVQGVLQITGATYTASHLQGPQGWYFGVNNGDNITIRMFNYTGDQADSVYMQITKPQVPYYFDPAVFMYESGGDLWDYSSLVGCGGAINVTSFNATCWFIVTTDTPIGIAVHIDMFSGDAQLQWTITRTPSKYSPDYATHDELNDLQAQVGQALGEIDGLKSRISVLEQDQQYLKQNITDLWTSFNNLNTSLNGLITTVNGLKTSDIPQLSQNLTKIKADIANIQTNITSLYTLTNTTALQDQIDKLGQAIDKTNDNVTLLTNTIPAAYNDTVLKNRITKLEADNAQLKSENSQLRANINNLNKTKQSKVSEDPAAKAVPYGGLALGIVALIVAVVAILTRTPKTPPKEIPKGKDDEEP